MKLNAEDNEKVELLHAKFTAMKLELAKRIVGQEEMVEQTLIAILSRGHALLTGVPGLAKTLLASTLAEVLDENKSTGEHSFRFVKGPVFTNMLLADEINRTPPKTQAALLEAMQEHSVSVGGATYPLPDPFFVLATRNPIEQEGTYPLPEAQLDRFFFNIKIDYPSRDEECAILRRTTGETSETPAKTLSAQEIAALQDLVRRVPVADHVIEFAADLVRATRPHSEDAPEFIKELVAWGAGPRAGMCLVTAAKARSIILGRGYATTEDVRRVALPVLRHRLSPTFNAEAAGVSTDDIITRLLDHVKGRDDLDV